MYQAVAPHFLPNHNINCVASKKRVEKLPLETYNLSRVSEGSEMA